MTHNPFHHHRPIAYDTPLKRPVWLVDAVAKRSWTLVERFDIEPFSDFTTKWSNFRGLVLGWINAFSTFIFVQNRSWIDKRRFFQPRSPGWAFWFFEIYKICNPLHRSDRKISEKNASQFWRFWILIQNYSFKISHFSNLKCDFLSKCWWNFVGISRTCSECQEFSISWKKGPNFSKNPWKFRKCWNYSEDTSIWLFKIIQACP